MTSDDVCSAAQRMVDAFRADNSLSPLYESVGLDQPTVVHMIEHALDLGISVEPSSFCTGALLALLAVGHADTSMTFTDHDASELLKPLP